MSVYVDDWGNQVPQATITVEDDQKRIKVTYRGDDGKTARMLFIRKPNPIGFHARLPGDKRT